MGVGVDAPLPREGVADTGPADAAGLWRTEIALRVRELRHRLEMAVLAADPPVSAERAAHVAATQQALDDASEALAMRVSLPQAIKQWWSGETITAAWESVHRAEAELAEIGTEADALAALPQLRSWMGQVITDSRVLATYEARFEQAVKEEQTDRTLLRQAYQDTITANVEWHSSLRSFRNVLFSVAGGLALATVALGWWHALHPSFLSLCRTTAATATTHATTFCFGDGAKPAGRAIFEILLIGAAGGLLSSAFLLGKLEHAPSRYNLLAPQIVLKAVAGSLTALVGVLLVQSHVILAPVGGDSTAELLAYAAVFGFSQQLLTQFVDKRAGDLLGGK